MLHTKFRENRPASYGEEDFWVFFARVPTTLNIDFSDTQGQLTPQSYIGSG